MHLFLVGLIAFIAGGAAGAIASYIYGAAIAKDVTYVEGHVKGAVEAAKKNL